MGAWGEKAFQNDSALDWVAELETGGVETLREALSIVALAGDDDFVDVDDGSRAVAAAEVVAAALGLRIVETREVRTWLATHGRKLADADRQLARRAVERVLEGQSELRDLWEANSAWHADSGALLEKLGGKAEFRQAASTRRESANPSLTQEKQVILTFLSARGFELSPQQLARIEASLDRQEVHRWLARATSVTSAADLFDD